MSHREISVSAIVPVHNGSQWLKNIFLHLEANLSDGDEIIFIENGSTDNTLKMLRNWKTSLPVTVLSISHANLVEALSLGISESSNNWIARFDVDDSYSPLRVKKQKERISSDVSAIFTDYRILGNGKSRLGTIYSPIFPNATLASLVNSQRTAHPSAIFNKEAFIEVGGYKNYDFPAEDLSLWLRLAKVGSLVSIPYVGLDYNLRAKSVSSMGYKIAQAKKEELIRRGLLELQLWKEIETESILIEMRDCYEGVGNGFERALLLLWDLKKLFPHLERHPIKLKTAMKSLSGYSGLFDKTLRTSRIIIQKEARRVFRTLKV